ncbi:hypothetical protein BH10PLA1_BH10PLA1_14510 [soil metagenome]
MRPVVERHGRAFTLVEMLVVIAIIAVLTSLLLPVISKVRDQSRTLAGLSNLRQIGIGMYLYAGDNNDFLPPGYLSKGGDSTNWAIAITPYVGGQGNTTNTVKHPMPAVFKDPNAAVDGGELHYASNPILIPDMSRASSYGKDRYIRQFKLSQVRPTSEVILIFDTAQRGGDNWSGQQVGWQMDGGLVYQDTSFFPRVPYLKKYKVDSPIVYNEAFNFDSTGGGFPPGAYIRFRQRGGMGCNCLFADDHAETMIKGQITQLNLRTDSNYNNIAKTKP